MYIVKKFIFTIVQLYDWNVIVSSRQNIMKQLLENNVITRSHLVQDGNTSLNRDAQFMIYNKGIWSASNTRMYVKKHFINSMNGPRVSLCMGKYQPLSNITFQNHSWQHFKNIHFIFNTSKKMGYECKWNHSPSIS